MENPEGSDNKSGSQILLYLQPRLREELLTPIPIQRNTSDDYDVDMCCPCC